MTVDVPPPDKDRQPPPRPKDELDENSPSPLVMLIVVAALVLIGWFITNSLAKSARIQDCVMSGRHNCAPISDGR
ncbi:MAG TPA: hypothetical protein VK558_12665 [Patescibacteria group bacterium]|nr:hypothetical protein [Patescibacteria group bacterium]